MLHVHITECIREQDITTIFPACTRANYIIKRRRPASTSFYTNAVEVGQLVVAETFHKNCTFLQLQFQVIC